MKKILSAALLAACAAASAEYVPFAERYGYQFEDEKPWEEAAVELPAYPSLQSGEWFDLYINPTYRNKVSLQLPVQMAADRSLRYVLAVAVPGGQANMTYEGMRCGDRHLKTFAFGDNTNRRWIAPRNTGWRQFDSYVNANDPVRGRLMAIFCNDGRPLNEQELDQRIRRLGGLH
ncbi:hypothetical protein A7P95_06145 [Eikenella longinqua]|uniref:CNP1-like uncharacterized domain-containing protein n=1 Tax=Eikenella longinqua TaxID=1795827 RepID=A0A1A9RW44_9NEIS|nr:CNP1-like family protein [Eikenella longinqua]OAM27887.1 hypothetical protein A7P95_06145 [Eikenella longinqua]